MLPVLKEPYHLALQLYNDQLSAKRYKGSSIFRCTLTPGRRVWRSHGQQYEAQVFVYLQRSLHCLIALADFSYCFSLYLQIARAVAA